MVERIVSWFEGRKSWRQDLMSSLELELSGYTERLVWGRSGMVAESEDKKLKYYQVGREKKYKLGAVHQFEYTGAEEVFLEFHDRDKHYHVEGTVDPESGLFRFRRISQAGEKGYSRIPIDWEVIEQVYDKLQELEWVNGDGDEDSVI